MSSSRGLTEEVCVRLMYQLLIRLAHGRTRRQPEPFVALQRAAFNANCRPSSAAVVSPAPVPATALPIAIAIDDGWRSIRDWRRIGLIDIGTRRPIGTRWCIVGLVGYRRWWRRNRHVIATRIGLSQS